MIVDPDSGTIFPVRLPGSLTEPSIDMSGITQYRDGYACLLPVLTGDAGSLVVILSNDLNPLSTHSLQLARNPHSICCHDGKLYIASTGTDSVIEFDPESGTECYSWWNSNSDLDTIHLNSLAWCNDALYATAFGNKHGALWSSADQGYLFNVFTSEKIVEGLYHPHSLTTYRDRMWFCESSRMLVRSTKDDCLPMNHGYLRGLAVADDRLYVGSTKGRRHSKSTGVLLVNSPEGQGVPTGKAGIVVREQANGVERFIDLGKYADEIYDVIEMMD